MMNMKGRIGLLNLISSLLVFALVMAASAQTRTVGVNVGNKWRWNSTATWSSNDPSAKIPSYLMDVNDTQWSEFTITGISGTNITGHGTKHYWNGTETTVNGWVDVDTGTGNLTLFLISANLTPGDSLYTSSSYATWFINETVPRTYMNTVVRDTNHLDLISLSENQSLDYRMYWDKSTGILVHLVVENTYESGAYTTSWSTENQIISSDLWVVPELSTWTLALLMLIVLTSGITIIARQSKRFRAL
jgi:hypothetical protein